MTLRVVIADDEKPARDRIRRLLADHPDFEIVGEAADVPTAVEVIDRERPDLCFLDVQMPEGDGFDVLRRIRHATRVVFTTAYDQYAVRAFDVNSIDYLLKPFSRQRFAAALARARESLAAGGATGDELRRLLAQLRESFPGAAPGAGPARPKRPGAVPEPLRVPARRGTKIVLLDPAGIYWFEAEDVLVFARSVEGRFLVERSLAELEAQLEPAFFRCHRGFLVNLSHVLEILPGEAGTWRIVLRDGSRSSVPLSRRQARKLRERLSW